MRGIKTSVATILAATVGGAVPGLVPFHLSAAEHECEGAECNAFYYPTPDPDPFYAQPPDLELSSPGTILDSRQVILAPEGIELPMYSAWHLKFRSTDRHGNPIAAVTTVVAPNRESSTTPRPLLSYQIAYNSLGLLCAPSHMLVGEGENNSYLETAQFMSALEAFGWALVLTDYLGPVAARDSQTNGQIALDAIRAATRFPPLGLAGADTPVALAGFSGGTRSTIGASVIQQSYAPELNLVGIALAAPAPDPEAVLRWVDTDPVANFFYFPPIFSSVIGVTRSYPGFFPAEILNEAGVDAVNSTKDGCIGLTTDGSNPPTGNFSDYTVIDDPLGTPGAQEVFAQITLPQPEKIPGTATLVTHSVTDEGIPVSGTDALVEAWCDEGVRVTYDRLPAGSHTSTLISAWPTALAFFQSEMEGSVFVPPATASQCNP